MGFHWTVRPSLYPAIRTISQSASQSFNHSVNQSVNQSSGSQPVNQSVASQLVSPSIRQPTSQSVSQSLARQGRQANIHWLTYMHRLERFRVEGGPVGEGKGELLVAVLVKQWNYKQTRTRQFSCAYVLQSWSKVYATPWKFALFSLSPPVRW